MTTPAGVIFDLDGLLVDSEPLQAKAFNVVLAKHGIHLEEEDFAELVGIQTIDNFRMLRKRHKIHETVDSLMARKDLAYSELVATDLVPCPGARELVLGLHREGVPLAVASSSPRTDVEMSLATVRLDHCFPVVVTATDVARTKPAPDLYLLAAKRLGIPPDRCIALEDSSAGLQAAVAAGMACIAVPNIYTRNQVFGHAVAQLGSLEEIDSGRLLELTVSSG